MPTMNTSSNKSLYGAIAMLVALLLSFLKVDVAAAEIEVWIGQAVEAVGVLLGIGGFILTIFNQIKANRADK